MTYRNLLWLISALLVLGFVTLAVVDRVEREKEGTRKWRNEHVIVIPEGAK